jgi:hypothetical protein
MPWKLRYNNCSTCSNRGVAMKTFSFAVPLILCLGATGVTAQTLTDLKIEPSQAVTGQTVTATIGLTEGGANCGLRFYWGDGATVDVKVNDKTTFPLRLNHVYDKPGDFRAMAEGKKVTGHLKCMGPNITRTVAVSAPAPKPAPVASAPMAATPAKPSGPACPEGWTLASKSVNKKTGAFTCTAKAGTALPATKLACPGDLSYFENVKKGQLGCMP